VLAVITPPTVSASTPSPTVSAVHPTSPSTNSGTGNSLALPLGLGLGLGLGGCLVLTLLFVLFTRRSNDRKDPKVQPSA
jgi:hypothetical protein